MKFDAFCDAATCDLMAESIDKYGEIAVYRLERYGRGSRFGSKFGGSEIKDGLYQSPGIYVFSDIGRLKNYIDDGYNDDVDKSNKGKLCQKIIIDRNNIEYPKIQFDMEVHMGNVNPVSELIKKHVMKNIDFLMTQTYTNGLGETGLIKRPPSEPRYVVVIRKENGGSYNFSLTPVYGNTTYNAVPPVEKMVRLLMERDFEFRQKYNELLLKSITEGKKFAYKITDPSIIKNVYYFYADALFR